MSTDNGLEMDKLVLILVWSTVLSIGLVFGGIKFYFAQEDNHIKAMGEACLHHVHNLAASADANLKDIYSFNTEKDAQNYVWQASAQCLERYPLYSTDNGYMFNLSLK